MGVAAQLLEVQKDPAAYQELEGLVGTVQQLLAENPTPALQPVREWVSELEGLVAAVQQLLAENPSLLALQPESE